MSDAQDYRLLSDVDNLIEKNHSMVLYENERYGNLVKNRYIENGLKKCEHSFLITHDDKTKAEDELALGGLDVDYYKQKNLLHVVSIKEITQSSQDLAAQGNKLLKKITAGTKPPYRFVGRYIPNVCTTEGIKQELELERSFHANFSNYDCSFLCTYGIHDIEPTRRPFWIRELLANHHHLIYAADPQSAVTFDPDLLDNFLE
jgi:hypothetical protein